MINPTSYRNIKGQDHDAINFVDDLSNCIGCKNEKDLDNYIKKYVIFLLFYYGSNILKLNDDKTDILIMNSQYRRPISIMTSNNKIIFNAPQIRILGIFSNDSNNMSSQKSFISRNMMYKLSKFKPALEVTNKHQKQYIIKSYILPVLTYCLPLFIGQLEVIKERLSVTMMKLYRIMYNNNMYLVRSARICNEVKMLEPGKLVAQQTVIFIHRIICRQTPKQIFNLIEFPA